MDSSMIPEYGTAESACFDIKADISNRHIMVFTESNTKVNRYPTETLIIYPHERVLIPTGFIFVIQHGLSMRLHSRSGHGWNYGVNLMNGQGIIDSDYPNETFIMLTNHTRERFEIKHGDRIAQAELIPVIKTDICMLKYGAKFKNATDRVGGFGSTNA